MRHGTNSDDYGSAKGCAPGCKLPARCGDGVVQTDFDEECDDGAKKRQAAAIPNAVYGGCTSNCKRGGRCGDGITNGTEACDDGVNDGSYGTCKSDCSLAPRCGDGHIDTDYGKNANPPCRTIPIAPTRAVYQVGAATA